MMEGETFCFRQERRPPFRTHPGKNAQGKDPLTMAVEKGSTGCSGAGVLLWSWQLWFVTYLP